MSDYQLNDTVYLPFTTRQFSDGVPTVLSGTPAIDIYEDATATPIITGETLVVSLNSVVGFNMITVTATSGSGFNTGGFYTAIIQAGTVGGVSVVGEVVATFSIDASAAALDLANGTDGLGAIKTETALIVADTSELQTDNVPGLIATLDAVVDTVKAETALIVADTSELQVDNVPGLIATLDAVVDTVKAETVLILADTADIQPNFATEAKQDTQKAETVLILADTAEIGTAGVGLSDLGGMSTAMKAEVNVEAKDVLFTDTVAELSGVPAANAPLADKMGWSFLLARNTGTQTSTTKIIKADDGSTTVGTSIVSDDGTTFTRGEYT